MKKSTYFICLCMLVLLSSCSAKEGESTEQVNDVTAQEVEIQTIGNTELEVNYSDSDIITLGENVSGRGYTQTEGTVTISSQGTYHITGESVDGKIIVSADDNDEVTIILDNVNLTSNTDCPFKIVNAGRVVINLPEDTESVINDISIENSENSVIKANCETIICGSGTLEVNANNGDGIKCKDTLRLTDGVNINIVSADDGIIAKNEIVVENAVINIESAGDGLKATNEDENRKGGVIIENGLINLKTGNDGIQAEGYVNISGGEISIVSGEGAAANKETHAEAGFGGIGGNGFRWNNADTDEESDTISRKGIKGNEAVNITGGNITVDSYDDSIHSDNSVSIVDGIITLSSGDDGVHADQKLNIDGGNIEILKSYEGLEADEILLSDGYVSLHASDDGVNATSSSEKSGFDNFADNRFGMGIKEINDNSDNESVSENNSEYGFVMTGGYLYIDAEGDGLDSNTTFEIQGGEVYVSGPNTGMDAILDAEHGYSINGGTVLGIGTNGMFEYPETSSQQKYIVSGFNTCKEGTVFTVSDDCGNILAEITAERTYNFAIFSSSVIETGKTYHFSVDGEVVATVEAGAENNNSNYGNSWNRFGGDFGGMNGDRHRDNKNPFTDDTFPNMPEMNGEIPQDRIYNP